MSKSGAPPFIDRRVMRPGSRPAMLSSVLGFTARPGTGCQISLYYEPVECQLLFGIDSSDFYLLGKLHAIGGKRLRVQFCEAKSVPELSTDSLDALKIGFLILLTNAKKYFRSCAENILVPKISGCLVLDEAVVSYQSKKGWLTTADLAFVEGCGEWELTTRLPLYRDFDIDSFVRAYFEGTLCALDSLESRGHWRDLFVLLQCSFDHLAWLARPPKQENVTCTDFCRWAYRYLRLEGDGTLTAGELYNWRCLWVHTYGGQPAKKYSDLVLANKSVQDYKRGEGVTEVGVSNLLEQYRKALWAFVTHCSLDSNLCATVNKRLSEMPRVVPV